MACSRGTPGPCWHARCLGKSTLHRKAQQQPGRCGTLCCITLRGCVSSCMQPQVRRRPAGLAALACPADCDETPLDPGCFCSRANAAGYDFLLKRLSLGNSGISCAQYCRRAVGGGRRWGGLELMTETNWQPGGRVMLTSILRWAQAAHLSTILPAVLVCPAGSTPALQPPGVGLWPTTATKCLRHRFYDVQAQYEGSESPAQSPGKWPNLHRDFKGWYCALMAQESPLQRRLCSKNNALRLAAKKDVVTAAVNREVTLRRQREHTE